MARASTGMIESNAGGQGSVEAIAASTLRDLDQLGALEQLPQLGRGADPG
jgi:hypothetical protein